MKRSVLSNLGLILGICIQFSLSEIPTPNKFMDGRVIWLQSGELSEHTIDAAPDSIGPVDRILIQDDHLNVWRALRTAEVVANQHKSYSNLGNVVLSYTKQILKPFIEKPKSKFQKKEKVTWVRKSTSPLHHILSSLVKIIKAHSSPDSHSEIDYVEKDIQNSFQFTLNPTSPHLTRDNFNHFMEFSLSKISFYLLLRGIMKEKHQISEINSSTSTLKFLKNLSQFGIDDLQYGSWYRKYMQTFETFEKLLSLGLQNSHVMLALTPSKCSARSARKILVTSAEDNWTARRYITNKDPFVDPKLEPISLLEDPLKKSQTLGDLGHKARELWFLFDKPDLEISQELIAMKEKHQTNSIELPEQIRFMVGYMELMKTIGADNDQCKSIDNQISKCLGLVLKVDADDSEAQLILWKILDYVLNATSKPSQLHKFEKRIENSVMFYLLIRRIGKVMESILSMKVSETPVTKAQCMQYYWSLLTYRTPQYSPRPEDITKDLKLGDLYKEHLISSDHLNQFYYKVDQYIQDVHKPNLPRISTHDHDPSNNIDAQHSGSSVSVSDDISIKQFIESRLKPKKPKNHTKIDERSIIQNLKRKVSDVPRKKINIVQDFPNDGSTEHIHEDIGNSAGKASISSFDNIRSTEKTGDENLIKEYLNHELALKFNKKPRTMRTKQQVLPREPVVDNSSETVKEKNFHRTKYASMDITQTASNDLTDLASGVIQNTDLVHKNPHLFDLNEPWEPSPLD
ncbi:uncharacterized protein MELLADRAFT_109343 [Melampsora larici-populina 98AG31]|uniref:Secreted protein n=1 Tax=Melampsora larici-populina (strain 98AG31 / pathotype 3-4-7) TaxID=747676 RepID=F4RW57_MELLP|nr:uncharacterized protein MELLADRAFT_109343 [Melampsora larici-populina 98AG31]EGG03376.1 hypothetical protein MELLADRAFT_109343 [Melampsora larici-populina 98AG31]